jgi:hypothetical protein
MPFHVELRRAYQRAWAFNLDEETMRRTVLEPWARGATLRIGDRDWDPRKCTLRVLEGERLPPVDLAHGQGWNHALRSGRDVASELLRAVAAGPAVATIVAATPGGRAAVAELLRELGVGVVDWAELRPVLLAGERGPLRAQAALVVAEAGAPVEWHFDAGLALGAFGPHAALVMLDADGPPPPAGVPALRVEPSDPGAPETLAAWLRAAGLPVRPQPARAP